MRMLALGVAASLLVAGCASYSGSGNGKGDLAKPAEDAIEATFQCANGKRFEVVFRGNDARLRVEGKAFTLAHKPSGSGYSYSGEGHSLRGKGSDVIWTEPSGTENACKEVEAGEQVETAPMAPPVTRGLPGTSWRLVRFQSMDEGIGAKIPPNPEKYVLGFASDGSLSAQLDCNRLIGKWEAKPNSPTGGGLAISGGAMTRALCQPGAMDSMIARDMDYVRSYVIQGTELRLALQADAGIYTWEAIAPN